MSKNRRRKKSKVNDNLIRELSLLLPSFSYIWDRLEKVAKEDTDEADVKMALAVSKKMAFIIKRFSIPVQQKALDLSNRCMIKASDKYKEVEPSILERLDEQGGIKVNVFSLGLGLFGVHHEHKNKVIHVGMLKELNELNDYCEKNIENKEIQIAFKYSDLVYKYSQTLPIV